MSVWSAPVASTGERPLAELSEKALIDWWMSLNDDARSHEAVVVVGSPKGEIIARRICTSSASKLPLSLFGVRHYPMDIGPDLWEAAVI